MNPMYKACTVLGLALVVLATGCATTEIVNTSHDSAPTGMGLDYRDFEAAARDAITEMLVSPALSRPDGKRCVMVVARIINDTQQRIDTDQLIKKIRVALLKSGKVVTTTAVGLTGPEDKMTDKVRKMRDSDEVDKKTVAAKGKIVAPDLSLSGKIIQRNLRMSRRKQQVEYYLQLTLTQLATGLAVWEGETQIVKRGSNKSVAW